jgi:hypothetical protein
MEFEFTWVDPSLVICRMFDVATVEGTASLIQALISQPQFRPGVDVITDHTGQDVSALTAADIKQMAGFRAEIAGETTGRVAIVVGSDSPLRYGFGRMVGTYADLQGDDSIRVFRTLDEAIAWLRPPD